MKDEQSERRDFLKGAMATGLLMVFTEEELLAASLGAQDAKPEFSGPPVKLGVIGLGQWGKELLAALARLPAVQVTAICDSYAPALKKGQEIAPKAATFSDYRKLIETPELEAVLLATPTHQHKELALAALQAGKHVYCEAPLAHTLEDAKAIALAAQQTPKLKFQGGLQGRANALYRHINQFVRAGVLGTPALITAQWNKRQSWRRAAPTPERERQLNWHLAKQTSAGIPGEIGIHQFDLANWYLKRMPVAVTGYGSVIGWNDGREVPDTVQCVLEYPNKVRMIFTSTLVSSFSDAFTLFQGDNSSLMLRERRGWLVKEADSALLGWEVYARKESVHNETGICMVADATKLMEAGKEPGKDGPLEPTQTAIYLALESFAHSIRMGQPVLCNARDSYQATVVALKTHEAVLAGTRVEFQPAWFELK